MGRAYVTSSCPHCGGTIRFMHPKNERLIGCMIRNCPKCGKLYFDDQFDEVALRNEKYYKKNAPQRSMSILGGVLACVWIIGAVVLLLGTEKSILNYEQIKIGMFLWFATAGMGLILIRLGRGTGVEPNDEFWKEYRDSEDRLKNPWYLQMLKEKGVIKRINKADRNTVILEGKEDAANEPDEASNDPWFDGD